MKNSPVLLLILDGWGRGEECATNAAYAAKTPFLDSLLAQYPHCALEASGEAVGLPARQMGNSEVGHLNIGAGRIVYQELTNISRHIKDGSFFVNPVLTAVVDKVKAQGTQLHLMGLVSDGGVHSHMEHLKALLRLAKERELTKVYVHAFLDGRDVPPRSALTYITELEEYMECLGCGKIATVSGRYYAMDRDKHYERVEKAYQAMVVHNAPYFASAKEGISASYAAGISDEFVVPFVVGDNPASEISQGDGLIFFNFRPDRARQITRAFVDETFPYFERSAKAYPVHFACVAQYDITIKAPVAYPPEEIVATLAEVVSRANLRQLHIAETEKYAHVTFFFNGGKEVPCLGEERILIPSPRVATYDLKPEMSARKITESLLAALSEDKYSFIVCNFANPDMVGHTGKLDAAIKAMETVDSCAHLVTDKVRELGGTIFVTADHGNVEQMVDPVTGAPHTAHTTNKVNFIAVGLQKSCALRDGALCDIAPTVLEVLDLAQPREMTGRSLLTK